MNGSLATRLSLAAVLAGIVALAAAFAGPATASAQGLSNLKIGVVNINQALNKSEAGERSKNILLAAKGQLESELKSKEADLNAKREALKNNMMLTPKARQAKEQELQDMEQSLRRDVQKAQHELQERERKLTESIYVELRTVIESIAREEKYDLVLEKNAANVILFATAKLEDLTDKVIKRYNKFKAAK